MIATTIEQSKRLLELGLDPSTADMLWEGILGEWHLYVDINRSAPHRRNQIPSWSLSALLEVMRQANAVTTLQVTSLSTLMRCKDMGFIWQNDLYIYDPTTAAYEMACYLLRNNLIEEGGQDD